MLPKSIQNTIDELGRLPGVGVKTAQRLTLYLLKNNKNIHTDIGRSLLQLKEGIRFCEQCFNFTESNICDICDNSARDHTLLCIVEDPFNILSLENTRTYKGLYHVLHGALAPLDGVGPTDLKLKELFARLQNQTDLDNIIEEVIIATNPSIEGEATALYIQKQIADMGLSLKLTRIAQGIPTGGALEYADYLTLSHAMQGRRLYN